MGLIPGANGIKFTGVNEEEISGLRKAFSENAERKSESLSLFLYNTATMFTQGPWRGNACMEILK